MAYDTLLDQEVCIKELFIAGNSTRTPDMEIRSHSVGEFSFQDFRQRFLDEAKNLMRLRHDNIVKVVDIFEENKTAYMAMEFIHGVTIKDLVAQDGPLKEEQALSLFAQLLDAVEAVHAAMLLHRDIKPDNVVITPDGKVVLIDFGAARDYVEGGSNTQTAIVSKGYAPLEQYSTGGKRGPFMDVYALGATLYFMLTGNRPVEAPLRHLEELPTVRESCPTVRKSVSDAVRRALEMKPEDRFQTVVEFRGALKTGNGPVQGGSTPTVLAGGAVDEAAERPKKKFGTKELILGLLLLGVVVFAAVALGDSRTGDSQRELAEEGGDQSDSSSIATQTTRVEGGGGRMEGESQIPKESQEEASGASERDGQSPATKDSDSRKSGSSKSQGAAKTSQPAAQVPERTVNQAATPAAARSTEASSNATDVVFDNEGNKYRTRKFGRQVWMIDNLKSTKYRSGEPITSISDGTAWSSAVYGAYANYNNNSAVVASLGRLYNWYAIVDPRNICPSGWHVPSEAEWNTLVEYFGGKKNAAKNMKSKQWGGEITLNFEAIASGSRDAKKGSFVKQGTDCYWWSKSTVSGGKPIYFSLYSGEDKVFNHNAPHQTGYSVRCVKD